MDVSAIAALDVSAPPSPAVQTARDDDAQRFQQHLDAQDDARAQRADRPARPHADKTKAAKLDSSTTDHAHAPTTVDANATNETPQLDKPDAEEKPAHASLVQLMPEQTPQTAAPTQVPVQQSQAAQQTQIKVAAPAAAEAAPPPQAQVQASQIQPRAPQTSVHTSAAQKPAKGDGKAIKAESAEAQPSPNSQTPAPEAQPTPQAAPVAATPAPQAQTSSAPSNETAINAVKAKGQRPPAPTAPTAPPPGPADESAEEDVPSDAQGVLARNAKANTATGAKSAPADAPDFSDLVTAAARTDTNGPIAPASAATHTLSTQTVAPSDASTADLTATRASAAPVASQVAHEIVRRANGENTRFEVRLDPAELGKIQVRLDVSRDHKVTAVVTADNPQALAELSRGARDLQQSLQSAGLDLADDGLTFDLSNSQNGFQQPDQNNNNGGANANERSQAVQNQPNADTPAPRTRPVSIESWRGSRIDVMA